ncbi:hypothetical protein [Clostridium perfringens]|uniref:Uncharacterized protein n=1 Tax=Clostridium perfringens TaxID=1502 RepID=A0AAP4A9L6_CLOPF|nr:hypothetical protein [Clostridium perfringens]MDH2335384.1 hypothetical protein [Clostridium perfringens]
MNFFESIVRSKDFVHIKTYSLSKKVYETIIYNQLKNRVYK